MFEADAPPMATRYGITVARNNTQQPSKPSRLPQPADPISAADAGAKAPAGAQNWMEVAQLNSGRTRRVPYIFELVSSDVLQADWERDGNINHTMSVTAMTGPGGAATEVFLTYHSANRLNVPFFGYLRHNVPVTTVWYTHVT